MQSTIQDAAMIGSSRTSSHISPDRLYEVEIPVLKLEESKVKGGKAIARQVIKVEMDLCEDCITGLCKDLGYLKQNIINRKPEGVRQRVDAEIERRLDQIAEAQLAGTP